MQIYFFRKFPSLLKIFITGVLIFSMILDPAAFAAPSLERVDPQNRISALRLPESLGQIEENHAQPNAPKTLIYIQDAHDSLEAQENIAKIIDYLVKQYGIQTVFEEGYEGPVPTDSFFGFIENAKIREKVSYFFLDKLRLGGAEYAHINRLKNVHSPQSIVHGLSSMDHGQDFKLIGADSIKLHLKNLKAYQKAAREQAVTQRDLEALWMELENLSRQRFPKEIKDWMKDRARFESGQLQLLDYLNRLHSAKGIAQSEKNTDFQRSALSALRFAANDPKNLFQRIHKTEEDLSSQYLKTEPDQKLFHYLEAISLLKRLNELRVTPSEYEASQEILKNLDSKEIAFFLARENHKPMLVSRRWEKAIQNAAAFYEIARARDQAVSGALGNFLQTSSEKAAVLVFGGFHREGIERFLQEKNCSYILINPKISKPDPVHADYYKQLMTHGSLTFEKNLVAVPRTAAKPEPIFSLPNARSEIREVYEAVYPNPDIEISLLDRKLTSSRAEVRNHRMVAIERLDLASEERRKKAIENFQNWDETDGFWLSFVDLFIPSLFDKWPQDIMLPLLYLASYDPIDMAQWEIGRQIHFDYKQQHFNFTVTSKIQKTFKPLLFAIAHGQIKLNEALYRLLDVYLSYLNESTKSPSWKYASKSSPATGIQRKLLDLLADKLKDHREEHDKLISEGLAWLNKDMVESLTATIGQSRYRLFKNIPNARAEARSSEDFSNGFEDHIEAARYQLLMILDMLDPQWFDTQSLWDRVREIFKGEMNWEDFELTQNGDPRSSVTILIASFYAWLEYARDDWNDSKKKSRWIEWLEHLPHNYLFNLEPGYLHPGLTSDESEKLIAHLQETKKEIKLVVKAIRAEVRDGNKVRGEFVDHGLQVKWMSLEDDLEDSILKGDLNGLLSFYLERYGYRLETVLADKPKKNHAGNEALDDNLWILVESDHPSRLRFRVYRMGSQTSGERMPWSALKPLIQGSISQIASRAEVRTIEVKKPERMISDIQAQQIISLAESLHTYGNPDNQELYKYAAGVLGLKGGVVADIGSGANELPTRGLLSAGVRKVYAVDHSSVTAKLTRLPFIPDHAFEVKNNLAQNLPWQEESLDAALFNESLHYLILYADSKEVNEVIDRSLKEAWRVLKPGGWVLAKPGNYQSAFDRLLPGQFPDSREKDSAIFKSFFDKVQARNVRIFRDRVHKPVFLIAQKPFARQEDRLSRLVPVKQESRAEARNELQIAAERILQIGTNIFSKEWPFTYRHLEEIKTTGELPNLSLVPLLLRQLDTFAQDFAYYHLRYEPAFQILIRALEKADARKPRAEVRVLEQKKAQKKAAKTSWISFKLPKEIKIKQETFPVLSREDWKRWVPSVFGWKYQNHVSTQSYTLLINGQEFTVGNAAGLRFIFPNGDEITLHDYHNLFYGIFNEFEARKSFPLGRKTLVHYDQHPDDMEFLPEGYDSKFKMQLLNGLRNFAAAGAWSSASQLLHIANFIDALRLRNRDWRIIWVNNEEKEYSGGLFEHSENLKDFVLAGADVASFDLDLFSQGIGARTQKEVLKNYRNNRAKLLRQLPKFELLSFFISDKRYIKPATALKIFADLLPSVARQKLTADANRRAARAEARSTQLLRSLADQSQARQEASETPNDIRVAKRQSEKKLLEKMGVVWFRNTFLSPVMLLKAANKVEMYDREKALKRFIDQLFHLEQIRFYGGTFLSFFALGLMACVAYTSIPAAVFFASASSVFIFGVFFALSLVYHYERIKAEIILLKVLQKKNQNKKKATEILKGAQNSIGSASDEKKTRAEVRSEARSDLNFKFENSVWRAFAIAVGAELAAVGMSMVNRYSKIKEMPASIFSKINFEKRKIARKIARQLRDERYELIIPIYSAEVDFGAEDPAILNFAKAKLEEMTKQLKITGSDQSRLYRILHEVIFNILDHGDAGAIGFKLKKTKTGFTAIEIAGWDQGVGIKNMEETRVWALARRLRPQKFIRQFGIWNYLRSADAITVESNGKKWELNSDFHFIETGSSPIKDGAKIRLMVSPESDVESRFEKYFEEGGYFLPRISDPRAEARSEVRMIQPQWNLSGFTAGLLLQAFGDPYANEGQIADSFFGRNFLEFFNLLIPQPHRDKSFSFREIQMRGLQLIQEVRRVMRIPELRRRLLRFEIWNFRFFWFFHRLSMLLIESFFGKRHIPGRNDTRQAISFVNSNHEQITPRQSSAPDQIILVPAPNNEWAILTSLFRFLDFNPMLRDVLFIIFIPFEIQDLQRTSSQRINVYTNDVKEVFGKKSIRDINFNQYLFYLNIYSNTLPGLRAEVRTEKSEIRLRINDMFKKINRIKKETLDAEWDQFDKRYKKIIIPHREQVEQLFDQSYFSDKGENYKEILSKIHEKNAFLRAKWAWFQERMGVIVTLVDENVLPLIDNPEPTLEQLRKAEKAMEQISGQVENLQQISLKAIKEMYAVMDEIAELYWSLLPPEAQDENFNRAEARSSEDFSNGFEDHIEAARYQLLMILDMLDPQWFDTQSLWDRVRDIFKGEMNWKDFELTQNGDPRSSVTILIASFYAWLEYARDDWNDSKKKSRWIEWLEHLPHNYLFKLKQGYRHPGLTLEESEKLIAHLQKTKEEIKLAVKASRAEVRSTRPPQNTGGLAQDKFASTAEDLNETQSSLRQRTDPPMNPWRRRAEARTDLKIPKALLKELQKMLPNRVAIYPAAGDDAEMIAAIHRQFPAIKKIVLVDPTYHPNGHFGIVFRPTLIDNLEKEGFQISETDKARIRRGANRIEFMAGEMSVVLYGRNFLKLGKQDLADEAPQGFGLTVVRSPGFGSRLSKPYRGRNRFYEKIVEKMASGGILYIDQAMPIPQKLIEQQRLQILKQPQPLPLIIQSESPMVLRKNSRAEARANLNEDLGDWNPQEKAAFEKDLNRKSLSEIQEILQVLDHEILQKIRELKKFKRTAFLKEYSLITFLGALPGAAIFIGSLMAMALFFPAIPAKGHIAIGLFGTYLSIVFPWVLRKGRWAWQEIEKRERELKALKKLRKRTEAYLNALFGEHLPETISTQARNALNAWISDSLNKVETGISLVRKDMSELDEMIIREFIKKIKTNLSKLDLSQDLLDTHLNIWILKRLQSYASAAIPEPTAQRGSEIKRQALQGYLEGMKEFLDTFSKEINTPQKISNEDSLELYPDSENPNTRAEIRTMWHLVISSLGEIAGMILDLGFIWFVLFLLNLPFLGFLVYRALRADAQKKKLYPKIDDFFEKIASQKRILEAGNILLAGKKVRSVFNQFIKHDFLSRKTSFEAAAFLSFLEDLWGKMRPDVLATYDDSEIALGFGLTGKKVSILDKTFHVVGVAHGPSWHVFDKLLIQMLVEDLKARKIPLIGEQNFQNFFDYSYGKEFKDHEMLSWGDLLFTKAAFFTMFLFWPAFILFSILVRKSLAEWVKKLPSRLDWEDEFILKDKVSRGHFMAKKAYAKYKNSKKNEIVLLMGRGHLANAVGTLRKIANSQNLKTRSEVRTERQDTAQRINDDGAFYLNEFRQKTRRRQLDKRPLFQLSQLQTSPFYLLPSSFLAGNIAVADKKINNIAKTARALTQALYFMNNPLASTAGVINFQVSNNVAAIVSRRWTVKKVFMERIRSVYLFFINIFIILTNNIKRLFPLDWFGIQQNLLSHKVVHGEAYGSQRTIDVPADQVRARAEVRAGSPQNARPSLHEQMISPLIYDRYLLFKPKEAFYYHQFDETPLREIKTEDAAVKIVQAAVNKLETLANQGLISKDRYNALVKHISIIAVDIPTIFYHDDFKEDISQVIQISFRRRGISFSKKYLENLNFENPAHVALVAYYIFAGQAMIGRFISKWAELEKKGKMRGIARTSVRQLYQAVNFVPRSHVFSFQRFAILKDFPANLIEQTHASLRGKNKEFQDLEDKSIEALKLQAREKVEAVNQTFEDWERLIYTDEIVRKKQYELQEKIVRPYTKNYSNPQEAVLGTLQDLIRDLKKIGFYHEKRNEWIEAKSYENSVIQMYHAAQHLDLGGSYPLRVQQELLYYMIRSGRLEKFIEEYNRLNAVEYVVVNHKKEQIEWFEWIVPSWQVLAIPDMLFKLQLYSDPAEAKTVKQIDQLLRNDYRRVLSAKETQESKFKANLVNLLITHKEEEYALEKPYYIPVQETGNAFAFYWDAKKIRQDSILIHMDVKEVVGLLDYQREVGSFEFYLQKMVNGEWIAVTHEGQNFSKPAMLIDRREVLQKFSGIGTSLMRLALKLADASGAKKYAFVIPPEEQERYGFTLPPQWSGALEILPEDYKTIQPEDFSDIRILIKRNVQGAVKGTAAISRVSKKSSRAEIRHESRVSAVPESQDSSRAEIRQESRVSAVPESQDSSRAEIRQESRVSAVPESQDSSRAEIRSQAHALRRQNHFESGRFEMPQESRTSILENKKVFIDFKDAEKFSAEQIEEIAYWADHAAKNFEIQIYNNDETTALGKFFRGLKLKHLKVTRRNFSEFAETLKGFSGEIIYLTGQESSVSTEARRQILRKAGLHPEQVYWMRQNAKKSGTLGLGLRDLNRGLLRKQLPDYYQLNDGEIELIRFTEAQSFQARYRNAFVFAMSA